MHTEKQYSVQMKGITKQFSGFVVLDQIELKIQKGSIHAILGENGAGKTTLMNILYGLYQADKGEILIHGQQVKIRNPQEAISHGIGMVHQHFMLVESFTVLQNILLGNEISNSAGFLQMKKAKREILNIMQKYNLVVDLDEKIENISVGMQQRVEILKALYRGAQILILDEPTAVLTPQEIKELDHIMHKLTDDGKTILLITHKLKEIQQSAQWCSIIRLGKCVETVLVKETTQEKLAMQMVGREVKLVAEKEKATPEEVIFEIKDLTVKNERKMVALHELNLQIRKGEILGIAGVDGNGQKELVEAIACLRKVESGKILINGKEIQNTTPKQVIESKVAIIHEDRQKRGVVLDFTVAENFVLENYAKAPYAKKGFLNHKAIERNAGEKIKQYDIRPENSAQLPIRALSGGNQQKVIIAREIANEPDVLVAVQPTRGLDVGAIEAVHRILIAERDKGKAILLISFELDEICNIADRIGVLYNGSIIRTFSQENAREEEIGFWMTGGRKNAAVK